MSTQSARRIATALAGTALLGLGLGVPAADARSTPLPKRCSALKGKDLLPANPKIKVVSVRYAMPARETATSAELGFRGRGTLGCTTPTSRVRRLGFTGNDIDTDRSVVSSRRYSVGRSAGTWLVERGSFGAEEGAQGFRSVLNVATGKSYSVWSYLEVGGGNELPPVAATAIDASGRSAFIFKGAELAEDEGDVPVLPAGATVGVATYTATGERTVVDSGGSEIVPSSLRLLGGVVSWKHGTETRTATFPAGR